ncbi:MAG TPA: aminoacyl-tRNA hydrolase [Candidatus Saccharimonadales bacterium]|nr:aminoacyl-tRNA hydrolase [Candidatus Saccharimonadales bacterium]
MAWLQKRPQVSDATVFYTVGLNKTLLLVGLGNPGREYDGTRHNIGFEALDKFVAANDEFEPWIAKKDLKCLLTSGRLGEARVLAVKPTTFMNLSGEAVQKVMDFYKIPAENVLVIHDELDIDFGQIRLRRGGSSAGHNGLKSIICLIGEDFGRIRIGIGPKKPARIDSADFVLKTFDKEQQEQLPNLLKETSAILSEYVFGGGQLNDETRSFLV